MCNKVGQNIGVERLSLLEVGFDYCSAIYMGLLLGCSGQLEHMLHATAKLLVAYKDLTISHISSLAA